MKKSILAFAVIVAMLISFVGIGGAAAKPAKFPSKAITLICPFNPGGERISLPVRSPARHPNIWDSPSLSSTRPALPAR